VEKTAREIALNSTGRFFCGKDCQSRVGAKPRTGESLVCAREGCGATFYRPKSSPQRFCSKACTDTSNYAGGTVTVNCSHCGGEIRTFRSRVSPTGVIYHDRACRDAARRAVAGKPRRTSHGYVVRAMPDHPAANRAGVVFEHRLVMEEKIGRPLTPEESVHHRNGDRSDNRIENLELWSKRQPAGQRVADKLVFVEEMVDLYLTDLTANQREVLARAVGRSAARLG
jgi:hypothetical protein